MIVLLIVAAYGFAGMAFLVATGCTPSRMLAHGRTQNPQVDAASTTAPGAVGAVFATLWVLLLAIWPLGLISNAVSAFDQRRRGPSGKR